jgi:hypothetical protein
MGEICIGISATRAPWSASLRSFVRDHTQGISVEVVVDRAGLARAAPKLDVLVVDDIMRLFSRLDLAGAQLKGAHVIGLFDDAIGMGRRYLADLGADQLLAASTPAVELVEAVLRVGPRARPGPWSSAPEEPPRRSNSHRPRGFLSVWTKSSGGAGLSEAVVAAAETLAAKKRVLLIEAEEITPVLVSRLVRSPETGLLWAVSRAGQGMRALPDGLSGGRGDGSAPLGRFDVVCATRGAPQPLNPAHLLRLVEEALHTYDHVVVEAGWLVGPSSAQERFAAARAVLRRAERVVVLAAADPEGAARLVDWKACALSAGLSAPCWAAFGRAGRSRYERDHLRSLVENSTGRWPFAGIAFLPEDPTVVRARWNAELVWKGPWRKAVNALIEAAYRAEVPETTIDLDRGDGVAPRHLVAAR